jgi:uncharacterized membrane protein
MRTADRRAIGRGALIAGIVWLGLSVEIVLSNVVFPSTSDNDTIPVLASYLCIFAALVVTGTFAARNGASRKGQVLAGMIAGMMIGALTIATFAIVDNVWLDIVGQQQTKLQGLARSGGGSMRDYVNAGLIRGGVFLTVLLGVLGAALSVLGGLARRESATPPTPTVVDGSRP